MTDLIADHAYQRGPYGRCGHCNKKKAAHAEIPPVPGANWDAPPASLMRQIPVDTPLLETDLSISTIPVSVRKKRGSTRDIDWPGLWPLPLAGQLLRLDGQVVTTRSIEFDVDAALIIIHSE